MKCGFRWLSLSFAIMSVRHVRALLFKSKRLGIRGQKILGLSLFLSEIVNMIKKKGEL